jgi:hypothetical protein
LRCSRACHSSHCQTTALIVIEAEEFRAELFSEDAVLLAEIVEYLLLLAVEPASEGGEQEELRCDGPFHGPETVSEV